MNALIYVNNEKDSSGKFLSTICELLEKEKIEYKQIFDEDINKSMSADAIFVYGGDGTILWLTEFSIKNDIPIIGINAGKLGFLTEFESSEIEDAVKLFKEKNLKKDFRSTLCVKYKDKCFYALNDAVIQRLYLENDSCSIINLSVQIDENEVDIINGDGVIISTPTGSTAYSLSAGGSILAPGINAFSVTPIAAHSLSNRPLIFSADAKAKVIINRGKKTALFIDGSFACQIPCGESIILEKSLYKMVFYRKKDFNFYKRLSQKIKTK